ncbi:hypothetical protein [Cuneatibacter caecimuris]|jgi:hypothetical protein|uniref:Phage holin n=1 Tax=Cuneatibacter caecimuris TaxID=1796618 RepID=A0A4Q7P2T6_9FIRM|nr:hypothetical protein [Cuneatibacter caecimuris]RZS94223.1 hypothetical protein EV209_2593 [Cuneatibacter caecimuris]
MEQWFQILLTIFSSVLASSGLWAYITKRLEKKDVKTEMLIGLGHDRIMYLGMAYIERGYITSDEYENLYEYLYKPYEKMGGNGSAKRIMNEVNKLPIHKSQYKEETNHEDE